MSAPGLLQKIAIGLRLQRDVASLRIKRRHQLFGLLQSNADYEAPCPVCRSHDVAKILFERGTDKAEKIEKGFCRSCGHMFGTWDQGNADMSEALFKLDRENAGSQTQVLLLEELAKMSGVGSGKFLDFGVGGNISAFRRAADLNPQHQFMGCDVSPMNVPGYFMTYGEDIPFGVFDGISSYAVVEHLTDTLSTWRLFNRLLKPMAEGGGIMLHAFPSQLHHDFEHWSIQIRTHTCLFSRQSLRRVCAKSGFEVVRTDPPRFVGPHYHAVMSFRKISDM